MPPTPAAARRCSGLNGENASGACLQHIPKALGAASFWQAPAFAAKRRISRLVCCDALSPVCMLSVVSKQQPQQPAGTHHRIAHTTMY